MRTLAQGRGMAGEEEVSAGVGMRGEGWMAVVALWSMVGVRVHVALQEMFVAAVKLVGRALSVVQEVGVWLVYLYYVVSQAKETIIFYCIKHCSWRNVTLNKCHSL